MEDLEKKLVELASAATLSGTTEHYSFILQLITKILYDPSNSEFEKMSERYQDLIVKSMFRSYEKEQILIVDVSEFRKRCIELARLSAGEVGSPSQRLRLELDHLVGIRDVVSSQLEFTLDFDNELITLQTEIDQYYDGNIVRSWQGSSPLTPLSISK